jgi:hypothetical protein
MSVEQTNVIDFISKDQDGNVVLTISDHLEWDDQNEHLLVLQKKINAYLAFIESGEIDEQYPDAKTRKRVIKVVALYHPNEMGEKFLSQVKEIIEGAGFSFKFEQKHFNSP